MARGHKVIIDPDPPPDRIHHAGFSSGWSVVTASLRALRLIGPEPRDSSDRGSIRAVSRDQIEDLREDDDDKD